MEKRIALMAVISILGFPVWRRLEKTLISNPANRNREMQKT